MRSPDHIDQRPDGRWLRWWREHHLRWEGEDGTVAAFDTSHGVRQLSAEEAARFAVPTAAKLAALLEAHGFREATEAELQEGITAIFDVHGIAYSREVRLSAHDRIDFVVGRVGIECKIKGSTTEVLRQLHRYAQSDRLDELVLVTTRLAHARVPAELSGKPVRVVATMGGIL